MQARGGAQSEAGTCACLTPVGAHTHRPTPQRDEPSRKRIPKHAKSTSHHQPHTQTVGNTQTHAPSHPSSPTDLHMGSATHVSLKRAKPAVSVTQTGSNGLREGGEGVWSSLQREHCISHLPSSHLRSKRTAASKKCRSQVVLRDVLRGKKATRCKIVHLPLSYEKHPAQQLQRSRSGLLFVERTLLRESPYFKEVRRRGKQEGSA